MNLRSLTIERTMIIILFMLIFALAARVPVDTDTWWHIRSGEYTLTHGMITADPFSFTMAGEPWTNHSWGSQIVIYAAWKLGGPLGLSVYMAALATAGMFFVYKMCEGSSYMRAFALILGAAAAAVFWSPRPQMFSFFLSAVILYILYLYRSKQVDRLWLVPVIMAVWGNLHAGFSIGFIFLGGVIAGEALGRLFNPQSNYLTWRQIRKLIVISLISAAALVINPYGLNMLLVPFQTVSIGALRDFIQEWNSPNFQGRETWAFIFLLLGVLGAAGASKRRISWTDYVLVSGTAFMALLAGRNIAVFAVAATPVLTYHLDSILTERGWSLQPVQRVTMRQARLNLVILLVVFLGCAAKVLLIMEPKSLAADMRAHLPIDVAAYIEEEQPPQPMFNSYNWGGYLMFAVPDYPVFVDGRTDLYGDSFLLQYLRAATGGDGWRETLDEYGIRTAVIETGSGLARRLRDEPDWNEVYTDDMAVVFVRGA